MPQLFADVFISVDGSASGTRSPGYFGFGGPELQRWIDAEQDRGRLDVMGRKTYQTLAALPHEHRDGSWRAMVNRPALVFSRTLTRADWPGVELCPRDAVTEVRRRKDGAGPDLRTVGSFSLVKQLLHAGLVDHLRLMLFPLVITQTGQQHLLQDVGDFQMTLNGHTVLDQRIILLDYRPALHCLIPHPPAGPLAGHWPAALLVPKVGPRPQTNAPVPCCASPPPHRAHPGTVRDPPRLGGRRAGPLSTNRTGA